MSNPQRPSQTELAAGELDDLDERILRRTAELFTRLDPPPAELVERISFAITLDALHAEVAELQRSGALAGVRADGAVEAQTITFSSTSLTAMVTISPVGPERVRVDGWLDPKGTAAVELRTVEETFIASADNQGRFVFADVPRGFGQFIIRPGEGRTAVITPSIQL